MEEEGRGRGKGREMVGSRHCLSIIGHPLRETRVWWRKLVCFISVDVARLPFRGGIYIHHTLAKRIPSTRYNKNSDANSSTVNDERRRSVGGGFISRWGMDGGALDLNKFILATLEHRA